MIKFFKKISWQILKLLALDYLFALRQRSSAPVQLGWYGSYRHKQSVDYKNQPIPWYTYSCNQFLNERIQSHFRVFEYGAGNSTLWFAKRVAEIIAVENDPEWVNLISRNISSNTTVVFQEVGNGYEHEINQHGLFDIIIIDGRNRLDCARNALSNLKPDGVIIWDNSDRDDFKEGLSILEQVGFKELGFSGMCPIVNFVSRTSLLYRNDNCLLI